MALSTVTVPTGFQPIGGNPLIFTFFESALAGKVNYRVEIEIWNQSTGLIMFNGQKFSYQPDALGNVSCDISSPCRTILNFAKLGVEVGSTNIAADLHGHFMQIFIKYQAVWDASSDAQVSLVASPAVIFNATKHIESDDFNTFPAEFIYSDTVGANTRALNPCDTMTIVPGMPFFLDLAMIQTNIINRLIIAVQNINLSGYTNARFCLKSIQEAASSIQGFSFRLPGTLNRAYENTKVLFNMQSGETLVDWGSSQDAIDYIYPGAAVSEIAQLFTATATGTVNAYILSKIKVLGTLPYKAILTVKLYNTAAGVPTTVRLTRTLMVSHIPDGADLIMGSSDGWSNVMTNGTVYAIGFSMVLNGEENVGVDVNNCIGIRRSTASAYAGGTSARFNGIWTADAGDLNGGFIMSAPAVGGGITQPAEIRLLQEPSAVPLTWLTDVGGRVCWVFDYSRDQGYKIEPDRRAPSARLFATMLTTDQFRMINELNKVGVRYSDYKKVGQRVLDLSQYTSYQDVYVIPTMDSKTSRSIRASTQVNIEYKELPQNQVTQ